jgi:ribosomal protein S18 acetylase RimI-like enzyme
MSLFPPGPHVLSSCVLRPIAGETEASAIASMMTGIDPWRTLGYARASLARGLVKDDASLARFAVTVDDAVVGVVCLRYPWLRGSYLETIALDPSQQGRGLGAAILTWWEERSRTVAPNLWLLVSEFNDGARRFYARHGFVEVAPLLDLVKQGVSEVLMRKQLA